MRRAVDLATPVVVAQNEWTRAADDRLILHPDPPGSKGATMRFTDVDLGEVTGFAAGVRTTDERCRPVRLRLELRAAGGDRPIVSDEIGVRGAFDSDWRLGFPKLPARGDVVLSCRLDAGVGDHHHSSVTVEHPALTRGPRAGRVLVRADAEAPSVALLLDGRFDEYFGRLGDVEGCVWAFHHLAKTAGTSILAEVSETIRPMVNLFGDPQSDFPDVESALDHHLPEIAAGRFRFVTGHFDGEQMERIRRAGPTVRPFTFLRHPVARYVSQYRYKLTRQDPDHETVRARYPTLEAYLEDDTARDVIFTRLRRSPSDSVEDVIAHIEATYAFVGITERYDLSRRTLFGLLHRRPPEVAASRNRTQRIRANEVDYSEIMPRLREANRSDLRIYQHFAERLAGIDGELTRHLAAV